MFASNSVNPIRNGSVGTALLIGIIYFVLGLMDPAGFKNVSAEQSERLFNRFVSGPWYSSSAQNKITVIMVDDRFVTSQEDQWPLSYYTQEWLVDAIASYKPKGMYLDFLYRQRHHKEESIEQYSDTLQRVAHRMPLYLPMLVNSNDHDNSCDPKAVRPEPVNRFSQQPSVINHESVIDEIKNSGVQFSYIGWQGCEGLYPSTLFQSEQLKTPAYALFKEVCGRNVYFAPGCRTAWQLDDFHKPMRIIWGSGVSDLHQSVAEASEVTCLYLPKQNTWALVKYQAMQIRSWLTQFGSSSPERGNRERCTYTDTISAEWFASTKPDVKRTLQELIEDRIVLVGARLDGVPDTVYSPVNGSVPGVYLFAMALDNYLENGANTVYQSQSDNRILWESGFVSFLFLLSCSYWRGFIAKNNYVRRADLTSNDVRKIIQAALLSRFLIPLLVCLVGIFCLWGFNRLPLDWIMLISLSFLFTPVFITECFDERPGFLLTHHLISKLKAALT